MKRKLISLESFRSARNNAARAWSCIYVSVFCFLIDVSEVMARRGDDYEYDEEQSSSFFYKMITGKFGAFLIVFMGLGGIATVFMTRQGNSSKKVPVLGIVMLVITAIIFGYRVTINAGLHGHEHIRW